MVKPEMKMEISFDKDGSLKKILDAMETHYAVGDKYSTGVVSNIFEQENIVFVHVNDIFIRFDKESFLKEIKNIEKA